MKETSTTICNNATSQQKPDKVPHSTQQQSTLVGSSTSTYLVPQGQTPFETAVLQHMTTVSEQMANFTEQIDKFNRRLDNIQNWMTQLENEWNDEC